MAAHTLLRHAAGSRVVLLGSHCACSRQCAVLLCVQPFRTPIVQPTDFQTLVARLRFESTEVSILPWQCLNGWKNWTKRPKLNAVGCCIFAETSRLLRFCPIPILSTSTSSPRRICGGLTSSVRSTGRWLRGRPGRLGSHQAQSLRKAAVSRTCWGQCRNWLEMVAPIFRHFGSMLDPTRGPVYCPFPRSQNKHL